MPEVLINASILDDKLNGVNVYAVEVIKRLIKKLEKNNISYHVYAYPNIHTAFIDETKLKNIELDRGDRYFSKMRSLHRLLWNRTTLKKLSTNYSLIYSPSTHGAFGLDKQIVTIHDVICLKYPFQNFMQYIYFKLILQGVLNNSTIIFISNYTKEMVLKYYKIDNRLTSVVYNGADHVISSSVSLNEHLLLKYGLVRNKYFITVGANLKHKNVLNILKAAERLNDLDYKYVVVGRQSKYLKSLISYKKKHQLDNVLIFDYLDYKDLISLYNYCYAAIYISLYEGFGLPPIEAAFFDKPSIVSNTTCFPEIYKDAVMYANPYDVEDISGKIRTFITKKSEYCQVKSNLVSLRNQYTWDKCVDGIFEVITKFNILSHDNK